jgi:hypothetical protein
VEASEQRLGLLCRRLQHLAGQVHRELLSPAATAWLKQDEVFTSFAVNVPGDNTPGPVWCRSRSGFSRVSAPG